MSRNFGVGVTFPGFQGLGKYLPRAIKKRERMLKILDLSNSPQSVVQVRVVVSEVVEYLTKNPTAQDFTPVWYKSVVISF